MVEEARGRLCSDWFVMGRQCGVWLRFWVTRDSDEVAGCGKGEVLRWWQTLGGRKAMQGRLDEGPRMPG